MRLYRTSVKEDINVGGLFQHLAENYVNKLRSSPPPTSTSSSSYDSVDSGKNDFKKSINRWKSPKKGHFWWISDTLKINVDHSLILDLDCNAGYHHHNHHQNGHSPMSLQIQIGGHIRTPPPLRTSIGSTGSNSSGHSSISHFSISPQEYLANPMFDSLNDHNRRKSGFNRYWLHNINHSSDNKTISLKPLVVKRTRSLQRKLPPIKNGCRVI